MVSTDSTFVVSERRADTIAMSRENWETIARDMTRLRLNPRQGMWLAGWIAEAREESDGTIGADFHPGLADAVRETARFRGIPLA